MTPYRETVNNAHIFFACLIFAQARLSENILTAKYSQLTIYLHHV